jgi:hypothetical protein
MRRRVWFQVEKKKKNEEQHQDFLLLRRNSNRISFEITFGRGDLKEKEKKTDGFHL